MTPVNYTLNAYTVGTWTDLVPSVESEHVIKSIVVGVTEEAATVGLRIADSSSNSLAVLAPSSSLDTGEGYTADIPAVVLGIGQSLQVQSDVDGVTFVAFGAKV